MKEMHYSMMLLLIITAPLPLCMASGESDMWTPRVEIISDADNKVVFEHRLHNTRNLTNLVLVWDGIRISVPQREIGGIEKVQYDTVRIMHGVIVTDATPLPYRTVSFSYGERYGPHDVGFVNIQYRFERKQYAGHRVFIPYDGTYQRNSGEENYLPYMNARETGAKTIEELIQRMKARRSEQMQRIEEH